MRALHLREEALRVNEKEWWYNEGLNPSTERLVQAHQDPREPNPNPNPNPNWLTRIPGR